MPTRPESGSQPIDVLIPAVEKDLGTLPHVIDAIRRHVRHPLGEIVVVAPESARIRGLCREKGCRYVDERTVLPLAKRDIRYRSASWDRSGWLYQQLLKLNGDAVCRRDFLVADADTVFIRPHVFRSGGRTVFYSRDWSQPEYFRMYRRLLGRNPRAPHSLVTHYMLFERSKLRRLKRAIETRHGVPWYAAILRLVDTRKPFGFSEYETYGNFAYSLRPSGYLIRPSRNRSLAGSPDAIPGRKLARLARAYRSLSFHKRHVYRRRSHPSAD